MDEQLRIKVEGALDQIRPAIEMDGGGIELVDIQDNIVYVSLHGHCAACPASTMTLKAGVEKIVREMVPEIIAVEAA